MKYKIIKNKAARKIYDEYTEANVDTSAVEKHIETIEIDYSPTSTLADYDFGCDYFNAKFKRKSMFSIAGTNKPSFSDYITPERQKLYQRYRAFLNPAQINKNTVKELEKLIKDIAEHNDTINKNCMNAKEVWKHILDEKKKYDAIKDYIVQ
jgi:hypothetical protein